MMNLLFWTLIAISLAGLTVYLFRSRPDGNLTLSDGLRIKWLLIAMAAWAVGARALATEVSHICVMTIDPRSRSGNSDFIECTPRLLAGNFTELFTFAWTWLPPVVAAGLSALYLLRVARERLSHHKEK